MAHLAEVKAAAFNGMNCGLKPSARDVDAFAPHLDRVALAGGNTFQAVRAAFVSPPETVTRYPLVPPRFPARVVHLDVSAEDVRGQRQLCT